MLVTTPLQFFLIVLYLTIIISGLFIFLPSYIISEIKKIKKLNK